MADKMSSGAIKRLEGDLELYLKHEESFTDKTKMSKLRDIKERIRGLTYIFGMEDEKLIAIRNRIHKMERPIIERLNQEEKDKSTSIGSIHVDLDCSNALKGLKAVQREARKATAALKELEEQQKKNMSLPTGDEKHHRCPKCTNYLTVENIYAGGEEKPIKQVYYCKDCEWSHYE